MFKRVKLWKVSRDNKISENKALTLIDSFGDFLDDNIEVDEIQVETRALVDEARSDLLVVDNLSLAVSLDDILYHRLSSGTCILGCFHVGVRKY